MKNSELTYKEIYGQPVSFQAVNDTLDTIFKTLDEVFAEKYDEVIFTGCGTSLYLAQASAHAFSTCTGISAKGMCCSELYYFPETYVGNGKKVLVVPMTRKSYTTEVRMAIDKVRSYPGVKSLAITCDPDSSKYNDYMLLSPETPEDSVIMTRSFTSMIYLAVVMSYYVGGKKEKIEQLKDYAAMQKQMGEIEERNRIAREIHDTLGHTMTGLSAGIAQALRKPSPAPLCSCGCGGVGRGFSPP